MITSMASRMKSIKTGPSGTPSALEDECVEGIGDSSVWKGTAEAERGARGSDSEERRPSDGGVDGEACSGGSCAARFRSMELIRGSKVVRDCSIDASLSDDSFGCFSGGVGTANRDPSLDASNLERRSLDTSILGTNRLYGYIIRSKSECDKQSTLEFPATRSKKEFKSIRLV